MTRKEVWLNENHIRFLDEYTTIHELTYSEAIRIMIEFFIKAERKKEIQSYGKGKTT